MDFTDKKVLITGGSRGIGRACAVGFAERGASVAINYLSNTAAADATMAALSGEGHAMLQADVSDPVAVESLVASAVAALGGLDIVVNNAGIWVDHILEDVDYDEWQAAWSRVLQANLIGPANVSYCAARHMIEHGGGRIVNVSSRGSFRGEQTARTAWDLCWGGRAWICRHRYGGAVPGHATGGRDQGPEPARPRGQTRGGRRGSVLPGGRGIGVLHRRHHRRQRGLLPSDMTPALEWMGDT